MTVWGVVGYVEVAPGCLRSLTTVWASHLSGEVKPRFYNKCYKCEKIFTKYAAVSHVLRSVDVMERVFALDEYQRTTE